MFKNYLIRLRVSSSFSLYNSEIKLNWEKYRDWNERIQNSEIAKLSSNSDSKVRHRRKRRKIKKKKKKAS